MKPNYYLICVLLSSFLIFQYCGSIENTPTHQVKNSKKIAVLTRDTPKIILKEEQPGTEDIERGSEVLPGKYVAQILNTITDELNKGFQTSKFKYVEKASLPQKTATIIGHEVEVPAWSETDYDLVLDVTISPTYNIDKGPPEKTFDLSLLTKGHFYKVNPEGNLDPILNRLGYVFGNVTEVIEGYESKHELGSLMDAYPFGKAMDKIVKNVKETSQTFATEDMEEYQAMKEKEQDE